MTKNLAHPQIHPPLAGADVAYALQQLAKAVRHHGVAHRRVLQPLVVQREALHQVLAQPLGGPAAELGAARRAHPVAHGQDGVEAVELHAAPHLPPGFRTNL
jgi:hypothetical protein